MTDLFDATHCDRCNESLEGGHRRMMSWFTEETICMNCSNEETKIRVKLPDGGSSHEGCGYIPEVKEKD